ncbi:NUDIX domain-containing protein [Streptomyces bambusae]|uniref:NUDIX domain-containing protein n=1 Tax=Streptomyces bambusae TaxID=1550616 RepID=A0ABS6Z241_9ACTN|nr:NUDIX hydrolase [Streptomyces bambusae]MBW5480800.1 NUDIX domain-containing protein [Streptomyces bambusae]
MSKQWLPPEEFAATLPKATVFGAVFFTDQDDRPVQLRATYSSTHPWQWPGGVAEPGERPWETAVRECREETGLHVPGPPRLLATVFGLPGKDWPLATVGFVFDGGRLSSGQIDSIVLDPDEHDQVRALTVPEWRDLMPGRDHARLEAVMAARRAGIPAYFDTWDWEA